ncbi:uncharacterized protein LOC134829266 [Culicoides brevitarsis]|uniref:uncharacterized protein LOC134829266 n=1 Tax=Culicoides brevitarsis TaxID=469753 RepID=UPI00307C2173
MAAIVDEPAKLDPVRAQEVSAEYLSSLTDLTVNSKPLISMLTMLAEENIEYASVIVDTIERHIVTVRSEYKLPILYLIDSIVKNLQQYRKHVNMKIVNIFCEVFSKVNEQIRAKMFQLRQTWNDVFPQTKLFTLDVKVNQIDPNWPITAQIQPKSPAIHVNPNFFKIKPAPGTQLTDELKKKQIELLELERKKQELERSVTKKTQNVQSQQKLAPAVGQMPSVTTLPKIPKVSSSSSRKDPRLNKPSSTSSSSNRVTNGDSKDKDKKKRSDSKSKSDRKDSERSKSSSNSSKSSPSSVTKSNSESSSASTTSPNKKSDRKRHRSPSKTEKPKRSRERSPENENSKREKKSSSSSSTSHRSSDKSKSSKDSKPQQQQQQQQPLQQTGDVDLRVPIKPTADVDLRQMPVVDITDDDDEMTPSGNHIDNLFGNQDLDLRTMVAKPPIIGHKTAKNMSKLAEVRAKLAADMKQKDNLGRPLLYKHSNDPRKRQPLRPVETIVLDSEEDLNNSLSLIVNQANEQLAANQINHDQYKTLVQQVWHINEKNKIQLAKRRESQQGRSPLPDPDIVVDRLIALDQVKAPPPAIPLIPGLFPPPTNVVPQQPVVAPAVLAAAAGITCVQPVTNVVDTCLDDLVRTINIDGVPRDIRFYNETAVVFMNNDDPREIGFENGQRRLTIDGQEATYLAFNDVYKPVSIQGQLHHVRLGAPTRELYLDNMPYECYIGGPALPILIDGVIRMIGVEGPEPKVKIGEERKDLCLGKIQMIIDGTILIPVFLDSKMQNFELPETGRHTLQIADYLQTILIDGTPILNVEYGGLPKSFKIGNKVRFIRFTTLPKGVSKGKPLSVMKPNQIATLPSTSGVDASSTNVPLNNTQVPAVTSTQDVSQPTAPGIVPALNNLNIDELFQRLISSGIIGGDKKPENSKKSEETPATPVAEQKPKEEIHKVDLKDPKSIKQRSMGIVDTLYNGMQCSSCGVRFPPEQTMKYSQHLDWHFRQNRRDRDASKKAHSRKWYYDVSDWIQFEEIEDLEEREKNWFEKHGAQAEFDVEEMEKSPTEQMLSCQAGPKGAEETCEVCQDKFEYFFNEENEEWHLKNAMRVDEKCYHPSCYEDFKSALERDKLAAEKMDTSANETVEESMEVTENSVEEVEKVEPMEEETEKIEEKTEEKPKVEENGESDDKMDETDDDDVIVLPPQAPVVTEILDDDDDELGYKINEYEDTTIDSPKIENSKEKSKSPVEEYQPTDFTEVKIKQEPLDEPIDNDDDAFEDVGTMEVSVLEEIDENTLDSPAVVLSTIDDEASNASLLRDESSQDPTTTTADPNASLERNLSMTQTYAAPAPIVNRIIVNITKPLGARSPKDAETPVASPSNHDETTQDGVPEDEPEPEYEVKPQLRDIQFTKLPTAEVGYETSGLCSIM